MHIYIIQLMFSSLQCVRRITVLKSMTVLFAVFVIHCVNCGFMFMQAIYYTILSLLKYLKQFSKKKKNTRTTVVRSRTKLKIRVLNMQIDLAWLYWLTYYHCYYAALIIQRNDRAARYPFCFTYYTTYYITLLGVSKPHFRVFIQGITRCILQSFYNIELKLDTAMQKRSIKIG